MARISVAWLCLFTAACTVGAGDQPAVIDIDSAGVRIVTNQTLDVPQWTLKPDPVLDLGTVDEGGPEATVEIPRGHRIFDIGEDYVLAQGRDDLDVERIRLFRLTRD